jgi:Tol biopolymer transport system component
MLAVLAGGLACAVIIGATHVGAQARYTIAYATLAPLNTAVFIANADGTAERQLVPDAQFDSNPSFSPDGRWVVFSSRRHGSVDLYRVQVDGSQLERLTDDVAYDDQPVVAPDGRHVAFVSSRGGQADIWVLDMQTRAARNLTNHPGGDYRPAFSPDGRWIAFTSDRDSEGARAATGRPALTRRSFAPLQLTQIYIMRADGSEVRRLTRSDSAVGGSSWSPDGRALAVFEASPEHWLSLGRSFASPGAVSQIVRVDVTTGARTPLTTGPGRKYAPQWLGDGRVAYPRSDAEEQPAAASASGRRRPDYWSERIAFTDGTNGPAGIFIGARWSPDGKRMVFHRFVEQMPPPVRTEFSPDPQFSLVRTGSFPSYSPDGRQIVDTDNGLRISEADLPRQTRMFIVNADGSGRRVLFERDTESAMGPVWSPRGDVIAFGLGVSMPRQGQFGPSQIALISPDGSGWRRVTPNDEGNYHFPDWSPDGKRLVLRVATPSNKGLAILDVDSGRLTPLTPASDRDNLPKWSPNGALIAFTSDRDGDYDIYTIHPDGTGLTRLTNTPGNDAHAAWSPDGQWIAFSSARGGFKDEAPRGGGGQPATDVFVMRADGRDVRQLTDDAAEEGSVAFARK